MKYAYFILISLFFLSYKCKNEDRGNVELKPYKLPDSIGYYSEVLDSPFKLFSVYLDSVQSFKSGMEMPSFLFVYSLDYYNPMIADHGVFSLRKKIFDSITNTEILEAIIYSNDDRLHKVINPDSVSDKRLLEQIPYYKISNFKLAKQRLLELTKKK